MADINLNDSANIITSLADTDLVVVMVGGVAKRITKANLLGTSGPVTTALTLAAVRNNIANSGTAFSPVSANTAWTNNALDSQILPAGKTGIVFLKFLTGDNNSMLGFLNVATLGGSDFYDKLLAAVWLNTNLSNVQNGTPGSDIIAEVNATYYGIHRNGSTGAFKMVQSADKVTWTDVTGGALSSSTANTADLHIGAVQYGNTTSIFNQPGLIIY